MICFTLFQTSGRCLAKMLHELLPDRKKAIKIKQGHKLSTKKKSNTNKCKTNKVLRTTAKMMHELLPDRKKNIKMLKGHKLSTTKKRVQTQVQNQQCYYTQSENATWTVAGYEKSHQNTVGTQAEYEGTKTANESSKSTKCCAQQQKWYMN